jgi:hypothetical protein
MKTVMMTEDSQKSQRIAPGHPPQLSSDVMARLGLKPAKAEHSSGSGCGFHSKRNDNDCVVSTYNQRGNLEGIFHPPTFTFTDTISYSRM